MEDLTGKQFGPYQIVAPIGEGGMAGVYKAYQPSMERYVAVKVLPRQTTDSSEFSARFQREAHLLAQLQHPHILPVFDYGQTDGYSYIVMPFLQSGTLADLLRTRKLSLLEIRQAMTQLGDALGYAHAQGMIHRDVKPSNVLIDERGNCLLTDFGLARMTESDGKLTSAGTIMGTPAYMSPEQATDTPMDRRTDIYSLGIILYELVTGQVPFSAANPIALAIKHVTEPLPSARALAPDLPEAVELVLIKVLAKDPADRYQTGEDFVKAIQVAIPLNSTGRAAPKVLDSVYSRLLQTNEPAKTGVIRPPQNQETIIAPPPEPPSKTGGETLIAPKTPPEAPPTILSSPPPEKPD